MHLRTIIPALALLCSSTAMAQPSLPVLQSECLWWTVNGSKPLSPYDSLVYSHSGSRNSAPVPPVGGCPGMWLDLPNGNVYGLDPAGVYLYDSAQRYVYSTAQTWDKSYRYEQTFNSNGQVTEYLRKTYDVVSGMWANNIKEVYSYNADGTLDVKNSFIYNTAGSAWVPKWHITYRYVPGKLYAGHTLEMWYTSSSSWVYQSSDTLTYDGNGRRIRYISRDPGGQLYRVEYVFGTGPSVLSDTVYANTTLANYEAYTYNSNGSLAAWHRYKPVAGGSWAPVDNCIYTYTASGKLLSYTIGDWNASTSTYIPNEQMNYTYNSTDQITSFNNNTYWRKFYYGAATGNVANVPNANGMKLYPVPAVAYVNLEAELGVQQDISIRITDMTGRCVKQFKESAAGHYKKFIPLMELPAGTYTITLRGKATSSRQFNVVH